MADYGIIVGECQTPIWGLTSHERIRRIFNARSVPLHASQPFAPSDRVFLADARFAFDPAWMGAILKKPTVLTWEGRPILAHVTGDFVDVIHRAMAHGEPWSVPADVEIMAADGDAQVYNLELRKRERPFVEPLTPESVRSIERQSYYGAYKGVTDLLTKYAWPELALVLTRWAAKLGLTPNMVTAVGFVLCLGATFAFFEGHLWLGLIMGWTMMVLDTVDGKLARCTITSSAIGNVFDHGIDLVHPPFWYWGWLAGLSAYGTPIGAEAYEMVLWVIFATYILGRVIEGIFEWRYKMHIHVWRKIDSQFRLITARRNPNVLILTIALIFGRPDVGILLVALWSILSLVFHAVRLLQALVSRKPIVSWMSEA
ncbi:CDP-alcohol phosphatidyltransferase family protein [Pedomonas mirosovicensis]|uniref:CDP-alcohol phosphatidyltransferase family protein n=1 Tax=Pedomonas mirosovicensis TaxID=2908641 RepID=UPI0021697F97|nr:CDP-alcohol phosphatidyltransferase family protein [Pedomonas mirosovicensis]MCH8684981.1 CDP-alcohol phosphatidyltransferase family protein [Pedomonas mirosovicensis]